MKIGDIKIVLCGRDYEKFIWIACVDCGEERWVRIRNGKPEYISCRSCGAKKVYDRRVILYPVRSLKEAYIQDYGKDLENHYDVAENVEYPKRIFCMDCPHHCVIKWKCCPIRAEVLEEINN